jgi:hypothetical protein
MLFAETQVWSLLGAQSQQQDPVSDFQKFVFSQT